jgi:aromatic ring-opening dioxygenase LigB subunit
MSINGEGRWQYMGECHYSEREHNIVLDDMIYIFHKNVIETGGFDKIEGAMEYGQNEWVHTAIFNSRKVALNVVGINLYFTKYHTFSGDIP